MKPAEMVSQVERPINLFGLMVLELMTVRGTPSPYNDLMDRLREPGTGPQNLLGSYSGNLSDDLPGNRDL